MNCLRLIVLLILPIFLAGVPAHRAAAQGRGPGLGLIVGEPTGICGRLWVGPASAVDMALAWSFQSGGALYVHGNYLLHLPLLPSPASPAPVPNASRPGSAVPGGLVFWTGLGARLKLFDEARLGLRLPVGLAYIFPRLPLDTFLEISPGLDLYPGTSFSMGVSIGLRFFFPRRFEADLPSAAADSV